MRLLWSLARAAPALLRHLAGYIELVGEDLERTQRDLATRLLAGVILGFSVFFLVLSGCVLVVALTWDTPNRVSAIVWMGGGFLLLTIISGLYRSSVLSDQPAFLATVRREWREDRVILDHILSPEKD